MPEGSDWAEYPNKNIDVIPLSNAISLVTYIAIEICEWELMSAFLPTVVENWLLQLAL